MGFEPDMKLSHEMVMIMGGINGMDSPSFRYVGLYFAVY